MSAVSANVIQASSLTPAHRYVWRYVKGVAEQAAGKSPKLVTL